MGDGQMQWGVAAAAEADTPAQSVWVVCNDLVAPH